MKKLFAANPAQNAFVNAFSNAFGNNLRKSIPLVMGGRLMSEATVTRNSLAWDWNSQGLLQQYAINQPVIGYNPATGALRGLQVWPAVTNLALHSQAFDNVAWSPLGATITANQTVSPDGTANADLVTETSSGAWTQSGELTVVSGSAYTSSFFIKRGNLPRWCRIILGDSTVFTNGARAWFDLLNGVVGSVETLGTGWTAGTPRIEAINNGWYRVSFPVTTGATTFYTAILSASADLAISRADVDSGAGVGVTYYLWQADVTLGATPQPPIETGASAVTRIVDNNRIIAPTWLQQVGTMRGKFIVNTRNGTPRVFSLNDGTNDNVIEAYIDGDGLRLQAITGGASDFNIVGGQFTNGTIVEFEVKYAPGAYSISVNGANPVTNALATVPPITDIQIGDRVGNDRTLTGWITDMVYYPI